MSDLVYHNPVLLQESVNALVQQKNGTYVDCTYGGGGHAQKILEILDSNGRLIAFDQDFDSIRNQISDSRLEMITQNFQYLKNNLKARNVQQIDGLIADLGVSSHQFNTEERGFSIRFEHADLDMRMNQKQSLNAVTVLNEYSEEALANILFEYGELRNSKKLARNLVHARKDKEIRSLADIKNIYPFVPQKKENKFYAQFFQAIRIEVNSELNALKELLKQSAELIKPNGRLVVISYHSLEDRLVKRFIKFGLFSGEPEKDIYGNWSAPFQPLQNKVIIPSQQEIKDNSRARSAKLRIGIKN